MITQCTTSKIEKDQFNVLVKHDGNISITDIGLDFTMRCITEAGRRFIPGNWQYKSPEDLLVTTNAHAAADVYSWAATVFAVGFNKTVYEFELK